MKELKEAVIETAYGGLGGAFFGGIGGMVIGPLTRRNPRSIYSLSRTQVFFSFINPKNPIFQSNLISNQKSICCVESVRSFTCSGLFSIFRCCVRNYIHNECNQRQR